MQQPSAIGHRVTRLTFVRIAKMWHLATIHHSVFVLKVSEVLANDTRMIMITIMHWFSGCIVSVSFCLRNCGTSDGLIAPCETSWAIIYHPPHFFLCRAAEQHQSLLSLASQHLMLMIRKRYTRFCPNTGVLSHARISGSQNGGMDGWIVKTVLRHHIIVSLVRIKKAGSHLFKQMLWHTSMQMIVEFIAVSPH